MVEEQEREKDGEQKPKRPSKPTYQQELVRSSLHELFEATCKAKTAHERRAEKLTVVAGAIIALVGGASSLAPDQDLGPMAAVSMAAVLMCSIAVYRKCAAIWSPAVLEYPSTPDHRVLYQKYIAKGVYEAYNQHLNSLIHAVRKNCKTTDAQASDVDAAMRLLQYQSLAVVAVAVCKAFGW